jgi:hypothetical protein
MALFSRPWPIPLATVVTLVLVAGCGSHKHAAAAAGLFDDQGQATLTCLAHQGQQPGSLYTGGMRSADTAHILQMMQYYTSNGSKPYCDGAKPTAIDRAWGRLYVSLGGPAAKVSTVLGPS